MIKNKYKEDIIKGYIKTFNSAIDIIENRKKFWFEVDTDDSDKSREV